MKPNYSMIPDHYHAVVAPMDDAKDAQRRQYRRGWAVVTRWLDPDSPGAKAELASYRSLGEAIILTASEFRQLYVWETGAWRRVA